MQKNDILIVAGNWQQATDATVKVNFAKTYILIGDTTASFSATEPALEMIHQIGILSESSHGTRVDTSNNTVTGIYAVAEKNDAPYGDWNIEYTPAEAAGLKLIRDGVAYDVGVVGSGTIVKFTDTDYFLKLEPHTIKFSSGESVLPMQENDILIVEGNWQQATDATVKVNFATTYITIGNNSATLSANDPRIIQVGTMYAHESGASGDDTISGIYFMTRSNAVPSHENWSVRYAATDTANVKLIRNGVTQNIAVVGADTIVKITDQAGWLCLENSDVISQYPIMAGDVLVVEGKFQNTASGYAMVIEKTYILIGEDSVSFTTHYAETEFGAVALPTSTNTLTVGTWVGSYHHFTDERLAELRNAGITKLIGVNPAYVGSENNNNVATLLDRCAKYGISVVIDLRDWDGSTVPSYAEHPALIGFLMYDEPSLSDFDTLADLKAKYDAVMPSDKLFYVNLYPECAADTSLVGGWNSLIGKDDYDEDYISAFLSKLDVEVLSWDNYSLLKGSGIRTDYYHNFEVMASKNLPMWYTMLSAGHSTTSASYATPTADELRWQMAVAMTYGVQNIDHYVYYSHESGYDCMLQCQDGVYSTTALYDDILTVNNEYLAWDNIFMAYRWKGVAGVKSGSSSKMLDMLENNISLTENGLENVSTTQDILVGVFESNGDHAYMITNAGSAGSASVGSGKSFTMNDGNVTLTLANSNYQCVAVISQGTIRYVAVNADNTVDIPVGAYEGVFVIPVKN